MDGFAGIDLVDVCCCLLMTVTLCLMSKSVYVRVVHDLQLLRYVLRCAIERQL